MKKRPQRTDHATSAKKPKVPYPMWSQFRAYNVMLLPLKAEWTIKQISLPHEYGHEEFFLMSPYFICKTKTTLENSSFYNKIVLICLFFIPQKHHVFYLSLSILLYHLIMIQHKVMYI